MYFNFKKLLLITTFMLASTAATAATIWAPTNIDTDFIQFGSITTNGGILALFDDSDSGFGNALEIGQDGGQVVFTDNMDGSWNAEVFDVSNVSGGSLTLTGNTNFSLGIDWGAGYFGDTNFSLISSPDTYLIVFYGFNNLGDRISGNTQAVDLAPIPVPAAVWLFGSGIIGLIGVARRKKA